jgi:hypothetical protein
MDSDGVRCHLRGVAARAEYRTPFRPARPPGAIARVARAFPYVLLVVTATAVAAMGGYEIGSRTRPSDTPSASAQHAAVQVAVRRAVAAQVAADRSKLRRIGTRAIAWQRGRDLALMERRISEQQIADGRLAARAYGRGQIAGRKDAVAKAAKAATTATPAAGGAAGAAATSVTNP